MTRLTNYLIESTLNTNGTPDPRVQGLVQALNARLSLVKQQLLIQSSNQQSSLLDSVWLAAEIGVEGSALENLKTLGAGSRSLGVADLRQQHAARGGDDGEGGRPRRHAGHVRALRPR